MSTNPKSINYRKPWLAEEAPSVSRKTTVDHALEGVGGASSLTPDESAETKRMLRRRSG